jgi:hypothetical protein
MSLSEDLTEEEKSYACFQHDCVATYNGGSSILTLQTASDA